MVCLGSLYPFKFFKGCLSEILIGLFLGTCNQMKFTVDFSRNLFKILGTRKSEWNKKEHRIILKRKLNTIF